MSRGESYVFFLPDAVLLYKCARWMVMLFLLVRLDEKCRGCLRRSWQAGRHRIYDSRAKRRTAQRVANVSRHARSRLAQWRLGVGGGGFCERGWCYGRSCTSEGGCFLAATTTVMMCQATNTGPTIKARMDRVAVNRGARQPALRGAAARRSRSPKVAADPGRYGISFRGASLKGLVI